MPSTSGLFAEQICHARDAARMPVDCLDRQGAEDFLSVAAGDSQSFENIAGRLFRSEGKRLRPERNALPELAKVSLVQLLFDLRLAGQHDLEQFVRGSLQIRQQPDFFQRLPRKNLRLIHNQDGLLARLVAVQQPLVQV